MACYSPFSDINANRVVLFSKRCGADTVQH